MQILANKYRAPLQQRRLRSARCKLPLLHARGTHVPASAASAPVHQRNASTFSTQLNHHHKCSRSVSTSAVSLETQPATTESQPAFDWLNQWYPVAFARHIDKEFPYRFVLMNIPLVIWWDTNKETWRVFKDVCPHRLVPLSEGRINGRGELECGYHGWAFDGSGKCTVIPQGGNNCSKRACAVAYPAVVRQGMLFVRPVAYDGGDLEVDEATVPIVQELETPEWIAQDTFRDLPYDWATLVENVVDASHVPFTHHVTISNRYEIGEYDIKRTTPITADGFRGIWSTGPRAGKLGSQHSWFRAPCYFQNKLSAPSRGYEAMLIVYATPTTPGKCRLFNRNLFLFQSPVPKAVFKVYPEWLNHLNNHIPLEDDQVFLHVGEETFNAEASQGKTPAQACYMPSTADTLVISFRNWLDRFGAGGPFGPTTTPQYLSQVEPRQTRTQLFDRYSQHTQHCTICKTALARWRTAKAALKAAATACLAFSVITAAVAIAGASLPAAPAAATACASSFLATAQQAVSSALLTVGGWIIGTGGPEGSVLRALVWAVAAAAALAASGVAATWESKFISGTYPPPRNLAKDPA